jgi:anti-sigma factor RsiW
MRHVTESILDEYLMDRLSRYRADRVEEHLSVCPECLDRLLAEIEFATAMRRAGRRIVKTQLGHGIAGAKRRYGN